MKTFKTMIFVISFFFSKVKWLQESVESVPIAVLQVPWLTRRQTTFPMLRQPSANLNWLQCHSTRVQTLTSSFYPIACVLRDAEVAVIMTYLNVNLLMWRWKGWKSFKRLIRVPGTKNTSVASNFSKLSFALFSIRKDVKTNFYNFITF